MKTKVYNKIISLYAALLIFYFIVILVFILAGSHGKLILNNRENLQDLSVAITFLITAIIFLMTRRGVVKGPVRILMIILNLITIALLCYQINLLYPERLTILSTVILGLHLSGLILAALISYTLLINFSSSLSKVQRSRRFSTTTKPLMENTSMNNYFDRDPILHFHDASNLIKSYFERSMPYCKFVEEYHELSGQWGVKYCYQNICCLVASDRGCLDCQLIIDGKELLLIKVDRRILRIMISTEKNILLTLDVLKDFFESKIQTPPAFK